MRGVVAGMLLAACLSLSTGCHLTWVRQVHLDMHLVNDHNQLLTVEGRCTLPDGAVLEARLSDKSGRRWAYNRGLVQDGRYFILLEIARCPGFRPLNLEVYFDPLLATARVQRVTGARGEALGGPFLLESHDRTLVLLRHRVVLTMSAHQMALRRLESGDGDIDELQSFLIRHPNHPETMIGLALAYLKQRPSERFQHSKAYRMLKQAVELKPAEASLEMEARLWIGRLDDKARREEYERQRQVAPTFNSRFLTEHLISPGHALGAFELGMPLQFLSMSFKLQPTEAPDTYTIAEFPGLRLTLQDGVLVKIASSDGRYRSQEGIGPGSSVQDVLELVPDLPLTWGPEETRADDRVYSTAHVELEGLNLLVERSYDPNLPLPEAVVKEVEVVPLSASSPTPGATQTP